MCLFDSQPKVEFLKLTELMFTEHIPCGFPGGSTVKNLPAMLETQETQVRSLGLEDSPGGGRGNPRQCSCLENPMDRGAWWSTVHRVAKSRTRLSRHA